MDPPLENKLHEHHRFPMDVSFGFELAWVGVLSAVALLE